MVVSLLLLAGGCALPGTLAEHGFAEEETIIALAAAADDRWAEEQTAAPEELVDIEWLTGILTNPANDADTRAGAALRLINMRRAKALRPLDEALRSGEVGLMLAVLGGLSEASAVVPELLSPLVNALADPPEAVLDPLVLAIARYGDRALTTVGASAADQSAPTADRLGAIYALGAFRSRAAAVRLMTLLDEDREEPERIVEAACAALGRGTGLHYGSDPSAWRKWWSEARDLPQEQWLTNLVQRLDEQLAETEQLVQRERERAGALERRIVEAYRDLFPITMKLEDQFRLLPTLMDDRLPSLRTFAIDRISRLLRDSVRIPDELQLKLADMVGDDVPAIRLQVAKLIDQLNVDSASERIVNRLAAEPSPEVAAGLMDILIRRPIPAAAGAAGQWLADPAYGDRAATVVWEVVRAGELEAWQIEPLRASLRAADRWLIAPEHVRVMGAIGEDDEALAIERLLDGDDPLLRRAVAEGFYVRGLRRPLLDRANDEVIYPFAVRSLARDPVDLGTVRTALAMTPATEAGRTVWSETIVRIASKLPADSLREIDDMLAAQMNDQAGSAPVTPQLRANVLSRARTLPDDALDREVRNDLLVRLAQQLLLLDQPQLAHEVMETVNEQRLREAARQVKFEAAARAGHHEIAAQIKPAPDPWVALLAQLAELNVPAAILLRDEISRRFGEDLAGPLRENFQRLSDRLMRETAEAAAGPSA